MQTMLSRLFGLIRTLVFSQLAVSGAVVAAALTVIAFGVVAYVFDRGDLKTVLERLRRPTRLRK